MTWLHPAFLLLLATILFSGCATSPEPQPQGPTSAIQSNHVTASGYIDVGARQKFQ
jgi:hypothetical protein